MFGCKEYNQSDFGLDHLVMSMCRFFSCVVGSGCLLWPVSSLVKTLLAFALLHLYSKAKFACHSRCFFWLPTFAFQSPRMKRTSFWVLVLKGLVGLHRKVQLQLLHHYWLGIGLDYSDIEWFSLETNRGLSSFLYCIRVLHFKLFCWPRWLLHFF